MSTFRTFQDDLVAMKDLVEFAAAYRYREDGMLDPQGFYQGCLIGLKNGCRVQIFLDVDSVDHSLDRPLWVDCTTCKLRATETTGHVKMWPGQEGDPTLLHNQDPESVLSLIRMLAKESFTSMVQFGDGPVVPVRHTSIDMTIDGIQTRVTDGLIEFVREYSEYPRPAYQQPDSVYPDLKPTMKAIQRSSNSA